MSELNTVAKTISWPDWAPEESRFWNLHLYDLALTRKLYSRIQYPFSAEYKDGGQFLSMWEKRPSIQLNIPTLSANILSRKLFGTKHAPHMRHDNEKVVKATKWIIDNAQLDLKMADVSFWAGWGGRCHAVNC